MRSLNTDIIPPCPGVDFYTHNGRLQLRQALVQTEFIAENSGFEFCLLSLDPHTLLYTCSSYGSLTGYMPVADKPMPLAHWLRNLVSCPGKAIGAEVLALLEHMSTSQEKDLCLVLDYCLQLKNHRFHLEAQISPLYLHQANPHNLFLCTLRNISHLAHRYSHEMRLFKGHQLKDRKLFSPPLSSHPILSPLSGTELRIVELLYNRFSTPDITNRFHMAGETLKRHRKNILHKTGFPSTDALVAVLSQELETTRP